MKRKYNEPEMSVRSFMRESILTASGSTTTAVQGVMSQLSDKKNDLSIDEVTGFIVF